MRDVEDRFTTNLRDVGKDNGQFTARVVDCLFVGVNRL